MTLNALLDIELAVPNPAELMEFWERHGMQRTASNVLGTVDRPTQMTLREAPYRHLASMHLGCSEEKDLSDIAGRLREAGLEVTVAGTTLTCVDPVFGHRVVIDVTDPHPLTPGQARPFNAPGQRTRVDTRADAVLHTDPRPPRRIGHVVLGTPHTAKAVDFYVNLLGYRVSDSILNGLATFMRVESDHHNLMIQPGPTSYLNHYAVEVDDIDAVGLAGRAVVSERDDASVVGVGRHNLGANVFWYLRDPSGNMFEFFSDMDQILDDEVWARDFCKMDWEGADGPAGFSVWGPKDPPGVFFNPPDITAIAAGRVADGLD
ncbi:MAG: VOC family protein [Ilumatobacteraceae bacterium]|nr:VOC family protein [Ilumatobacteraceae bacterium]